MSAIQPGATIGFLGGGQLGRMTAMAAREMGYRVHALDPDPNCPIKPVVDKLITAKFDDAAAAEELARDADVVTLEIEQIGTASLDAVQRHVPLRPGAHAVHIIQDRGRQKTWLRQKGFPLGPYRDVTTGDELQAAANELGALFVKANHGGYDGRSQARVADASQAAAAWESLGGRPSVAEQALDLEAELSVMVARRPNGEVKAYPPALNHHERQVLSWSVIPAPLPAKVLEEATSVARGIISELDLVGLLAVEMFLTRDGKLFVNELAPRPHNSYHESVQGCLTSQFEQLVRAVCDLPLGDVSVLRPAAIVNLFGDLWTGDVAPDWSRALDEPFTRLHLYGKASARPGRKMGHLSAVGATPQEALLRAQGAFARLLESSGTR